MFICSGILFNHESPRRGKEFVTRKITSGIKAIMDGKESKLRLGNMDAKRDWGFSGDYVRAMWLMLQHDVPDDYVVATNETHTIKEFVDEAFHVANKILEREGKLGFIPADCIEIDQNMMRPSDVQLLKGDYSKAKKVLGWEPNVKFKDLVKMMMEEENENPCSS
jgi:GDPmannose 4,6-dehydratase